MKLKIIGGAVLTALLFSCASKAVAVKETPAPTPTPPTAPAVSATDLAAGKNLFENNCTHCHRLYAPSEFPKEEWKPILVKMQKKANLDDSQMANISAYIDSQL